MPVTEGSKSDKFEKGQISERASNPKTISSNQIHKIIKLVRNEIINKAEELYKSNKYEEAVI